MMADVIIFGPTGAVGRAAAQEASERGAKVWLAMRDPNKKIEGLDESDGRFSRIKADLNDPDSVKHAIKQSGAKSAFFYAVMNESGMGDTIQAMKDAGITWAVLLSSYTVRGDPRSYTKEDYISWHHAQVEILLEDVGIPFAAVRPGHFITNDLRMLADIKKGKVNLPNPDTPYDFVVQKNIGELAGVLLVEAKPSSRPSEPQIAFLTGPQLISRGDAIRAFGKAGGKDVEIEKITPDQWADGMKGKFPDVLLQYFLKVYRAEQNGTSDLSKYDDAFQKEASENYYKYTGKQPTTFDQWVQANKHQFAD